MRSVESEASDGQFLIPHSPRSLYALLMQQILFTDNVSASVMQVVADMAPDAVFLFADSHTSRLCLPLLGPVSERAKVITMPAGEANKNFETLTSFLAELSDSGCTRHSLIINVGGGVVTDLGGFGASIFKRGVPFLSIPTSLLAMVDASVGGKTGIDFNGCKNEVGAFAPASKVIISSSFLQTLDVPNLLSGYAEMLKHSLLIGEESWRRHICFLPDDLSHLSFVDLGVLIQESVACKQRITTADPSEQGIRKSLNLGHTLGHALESLLLQRGHPVLHGYAVAWGVVASLYISVALCDFPSDVLRATSHFVLERYGRPPITCKDYPALHALMLHDKKNRAGRLRFTLLKRLGEVCLDVEPSTPIIEEALDFLREA